MLYYECHICSSKSLSGILNVGTKGQKTRRTTQDSFSVHYGDVSELEHNLQQKSSHMVGYLDSSLRVLFVISVHERLK